MKLKPTADQLLIKTIARAERTKSGIILPDGSSETQFVYCEVISVGPGTLLANGMRNPVAVNIGDTVVVHQTHANNASRKIKIDDVEYILIKESDIAMCSTEKD
jgi:chaperonin GroES